MSLGMPDIIIQPRLDEFLLFLAEPRDLLWEVCDSEEEDEGSRYCQRSLCAST